VLLKQMKNDYRKVTGSFKWIIGLLLVGIVSMGAKQIAYDAVKARDIRDLQSIVVPNYDVVSMIQLLDLKTDLLFAIKDEEDQMRLETEIEEINQMIYDIKERNSARLEAIRGDKINKDK